MGIAAYNRGSKLIRAQIDRERGDTSADRPKAKRPVDEARRAEVVEKACAVAKRLRSYYVGNNIEFTDEDLAHFVRESVRCSRATANLAVERSK